ncbi:Alkylated DNA repair protein alkB 8 [Phlyctochytrium bullatum]|nr:Alkylated DNA repair protein alkB 8 [Phlyctochytrium bullatum]
MAPSIASPSSTDSPVDGDIPRSDDTIDLSLLDFDLAIDTNTNTSDDPGPSTADPSPPRPASTSLPPFLLKRIAAAHRAISQKEATSIHDLLHVDPATHQEDPAARDDPLASRFLCVLNVGSSSFGEDFGKLETWLGELEGVELVMAGKGKAYTFITFATPTQAHAALQALQLRPLSPPTPPHTTPTRLLLVQKAHRMPLTEADMAHEDPAEVERLVPGLKLVLDFVTEEEEASLLEMAERNGEWVHLAKRKVQHHGIHFDYSTNRFGTDPYAPNPTLPSYTSFVLTRLASHFPTYLPSNQLTINHYPPGAGIRPHVDTHSSFDGPVVSLSLGAPCLMEFRYLPPPPPHAFPGLDPVEVTRRNDAAPKDAGTAFRIVNVWLPRRSVVVMDGAARFGWEHCIRPRTSDVVGGRRVERGARVSFTFRRVRLPPERRCGCGFWWLCDAEMPGGALPERFKEETERRIKWW